VLEVGEMPERCEKPSESACLRSIWVGGGPAWDTLRIAESGHREGEYSSCNPLLDTGLRRDTECECIY
jgi:hypothetical protein